MIEWSSYLLDLNYVAMDPASWRQPFDLPRM